MCRFVTAILPASANVPELDKLARRHHRQFMLQPNSSIEAELLPGERNFLTTLVFSQFGFDLIAMMQGTYEVGRLSSFHGMGSWEWDHPKT